VEIARPYVKNALLRETSITGSIAWYDMAEEYLSDNLIDPQELDELDREQLIEELSEVLRGNLPPPNGKEIDEHTRDLVQMMISSWIEVLREALSLDWDRKLTEELLPPIKCLTSTQDIVPQAWQAFEGNIAPFAISEKDAKCILHDLGLELCRLTNGRVPLPCNLIIIFENRLQGSQIISLHRTQEASDGT
jgi:hypothetical protein